MFCDFRAGVLSYATGDCGMKQNTPIYGIIGTDIGYSLSPTIYNQLFAQKNIRAIYNVFDLRNSDLNDFIKSVRLLPLAGFNVTIPHKRAILPLLDRLDFVAEQTQSANLVINRKGVLHGYNTDYEGIRQSVENRLKVSVRGASVVVIGSGGGAQTAYYYLVSHGARAIHVYHRSPASLLRFGAFVRRLPRPASYRPALLEESIDDLGGCDLCINCTPAPITDLAYGNVLRRVKMILELRYGSYDIIKRAHLRGNYMLAVQAARNFKIMTGQEVTVNRVLKIIDGALHHD
jgi:shikimate dehydrogenase